MVHVHDKDVTVDFNNMFGKLNVPKVIPERTFTGDGTLEHLSNKV